MVYLLLSLAVYALPFFIGMQLYETEVGVLTAIIVVGTAWVRIASLAGPPEEGD